MASTIKVVAARQIIDNRKGKIEIFFVIEVTDRESIFAGLSSHKLGHSRST